MNEIIVQKSEKCKGLIGMLDTWKIDDSFWDKFVNMSPTVS